MSAAVRHVVRVEGWDPFPIRADQTLLEACEDAGVPMDSACGGFACCNACRVTVLEGGAAAGVPLPEELPFLDAPAQRLGCQVRTSGDLVVRLDPGLW